jgi:hypothetical protein
MNKNTSTFRYISDFNESSASLILIMLLCADLGFITLHLVNTPLTPFLRNPLFDIERDKGYSEVYQYIKWFWIIILLINLSISKRSFRYVVWGLLFTYLLFDDALSIHEEVGGYLVSNLTLNPPFGLRDIDLGELAVSAAAGMILFSLILWAYVRGSYAFKKMSQDMVVLILVLVFFGIVVDMAHVTIPRGKVTFMLGIIEDGGEMLMASLILWYVFLLSVRDEKSSSSLCGFARLVLTKPPA